MLTENKVDKRKYMILAETMGMSVSDTVVDIAKRCGLKRDTMSKFIRKEWNMTFKELRESLQKDEVDSPISLWLPIPLTKKEKRDKLKPTHTINSFTDWNYRTRLACPIVSTEDRSWSKKRIAPLKVSFPVKLKL